MSQDTRLIRRPIQYIILFRKRKTMRERERERADEGKKKTKAEREREGAELCGSKGR